VSVAGGVFKRLLVGRPQRSDRLGESLLPKRIALPVFASDALSCIDRLDMPPADGPAGA
jgi:hypothetical protein